MARNRRNTEPRQIKAKFPSQCAETGRPIAAGEYCIFYPGSGRGRGKVFHDKSKQAQTYRECLYDEEVLGYSY